MCVCVSRGGKYSVRKSAGEGGGVYGKEVECERKSKRRSESVWDSNRVREGRM